MEERIIFQGIALSPLMITVQIQNIFIKRGVETNQNTKEKAIQERRSKRENIRRESQIKREEDILRVAHPLHLHHHPLLKKEIEIERGTD